jgi:hypothetical protein
MKPEREFESHKQDLQGTGNPDAKSDLNRETRGSSGRETPDSPLSDDEKLSSATEYVEELEDDKDDTDDMADPDNDLDEDEVNRLFPGQNTD